MAVKRISPTEAQALVESGYLYVDVRSVPEYAQGHPAGARNVPLMHLGGAGMSPNPDFVAVMERAFPRDAKLVLGCKAGGRSQRAAMLLEAAGFTNLMEMKGGFSGESDSMGRVVDKGWAASGLPVSTTPEAGATWDELKAK